MRQIDLLGKVFGRLNVLSLSNQRKDGGLCWECQCSCGKKVTIRSHNLIQGNSKSCGCIRKDLPGGSKPGYINPVTSPKIHPTIKDIYWAAGIYEGEGSCGGDITACVTQKEAWLINRLTDLFGGRNRPRANFHAWTISGGRARGFLMTIYPLLSPRRQIQIKTRFSK